MPGNLQGDVGRKLVRGGMTAILARCAAMALNAITMPILARVLEPKDFGIYLLANSFYLPFAIIGALGLQMTLVRDIAGTAQGGGLFRTVLPAFRLALYGALGAAALFLGLAESGRLQAFTDVHFAGISALVALWIAAHVFNMLVGETFRGLHDIRRASWFGGLATNGLMAIGALVLLVKKQAGLWDAVSVAAGSTVITAGFGLLLMWTQLRYRDGQATQALQSVRVQSSAALLRESLPLMIAALFSVLTPLVDVWIVGTCCSEQDVALYGAAAKLALLVVTPQLVVASVIPPIVSELYNRGELPTLQNVLRTTATIAGLPSAAGLIGMALFAPQILSLFYGPFYAEAAPILRVLAVGYAVFVLCGSGGIVLAMTRRSKVAMCVNVVATLYTVGLGYLAATWTGTLGAAVVTASSLALQKLVMLIWIRCDLGIWSHSYILPRMEDILHTLRGSPRSRTPEAVVVEQAGGSLG